MKKMIEKEKKKTQVKKRVKELKEELMKVKETAEQNDSMILLVNEIDKLMINKQSENDYLI
jgi:hypothetical protein